LTGVNFRSAATGKEAISRAVINGSGDIGTGPLGTLGKIIWFLCAGVWLAIGHLATALTLFVTIVWIPFGWQHIKMAGLAWAPIGKTIVNKP
jgi:uncharacterized membrane protein YccF (DUF307 family)